MSSAHPPHPELVLLCGGTQQQRAELRETDSEAMKAAVTTSDIQSLLHWAPRSRAVIVCGELAGVGAATIERMVKRRAPGVRVLNPGRVSVADKASMFSDRAAGNGHAGRRAALRVVPGPRLAASTG